MVEAEERSSRVIVIGPAFRNIANTPDDGDGPQSLPHRHAPEDAKSDPHAEEIADVSAYILSLRNHS
jgi:hypothetical protein